jgi:hypothetical protein
MVSSSDMARCLIQLLLELIHQEDKAIDVFNDCAGGRKYVSSETIAFDSVPDGTLHLKDGHLGMVGEHKR